MHGGGRITLDLLGLAAWSNLGLCLSLSLVLSLTDFPLTRMARVFFFSFLLRGFHPIDRPSPHRLAFSIVSGYLINK